MKDKNCQSDFILNEILLCKNKQVLTVHKSTFSTVKVPYSKKDRKKNFPNTLLLKEKVTLHANHLFSKKKN